MSKKKTRTAQVVNTAGLSSWGQLVDSSSHRAFAVTDTSSGSSVYVRSILPPGKFIEENPQKPEKED